MKMCNNEHQPMDIRLYSNRRSNLDLEELNRMERPSRVFSSRHHYYTTTTTTTPPVVTSMEDNNRRYRESNYTSSQRMIAASTGEVVNLDEPRRSRDLFGSFSNGTLRLNSSPTNRSSFVNFTITDPETRQVTAAGQIPLIESSPPSSPSHRYQTSANSADRANSQNNGSGDESPVIEYQRPRSDHYNTGTSQQSRYSRSGRRTRRITEHPYLTRQDENNPNGRTFSHRRVRFSSTNQNFFDLSRDRSHTPEQELPEVEEQEIEPANQYEADVTFHGEESMSSVSTINDDYSIADDLAGGDDLESNFSASENQNSISDLHRQIRDFVYIPNDTPRTRVVPFVVSPIPLSPREVSTPDSIISETSPLDTSRDNDLPSLTPFSLPLPSFAYSGTHAAPVSIEYMQFNSVSGSDIPNNATVNRTTGAESSNTVDNTSNGQATSSVTVRDLLNIIDTARAIGNPITSSPTPTVLPRTMLCDNHQPTVVTEETASVHIGEHPETYDDLNDQLTRLFECPVCFEHIVPPIFQCLVGHLICNKCVLMCESCPSCRNPFNSKRNLYMEKVGYLVKFPCRNALTGCKQQMFIGQKEIHEQSCCYRHYQCFFTNCAWKGYYPELHSHMSLNHSNCILHGTEQSLDIMLPNNNQTNKWFLLAHGEYFAIIAHSSVPPRRVKVQVNYIGQAIKAKNFKFVITLTQNKDSNEDIMAQKLVYERLTLPYSEIYEMSNNNGLKKDIFSLPGEVLEPYIKKRRLRLPINLKVHPKNNLS